jgi:hypothetical protein
MGNSTFRERKKEVASKRQPLIKTQLFSLSMNEIAHEIKACRHRDRDHEDCCCNQADASEDEDDQTVRDLLEDADDT